MIEYLYAELLQPTAQDLHVVGASERAAIDLAPIIARKAISPVRQAKEIAIGLVQHAIDTIDARESHAHRKTTSEDMGVLRAVRRDMDDGGVGAGHRAAGANAPLVRERDARARLRRGGRRPSSRPAPPRTKTSTARSIAGPGGEHFDAITTPCRERGDERAPSQSRHADRRARGTDWSSVK